MSLRLTYDLFKGLTPEAFQEQLDSTARRLAKAIEVKVEHHGDVHVLMFKQYSGDNYQFCKALGEDTGLPWIELRIAEGALWDYTLHQGAARVDDFSVLPEYWESPDDCTPEQWEKYLLDRKGEPELFAKLWQIPLMRIERYVRQWGWVHDPEDEDVVHHVLTGKAYPNDKYEYGECRQMFDFYRVLTGTEGTNDWTNKAKRGAAWCKMISAPHGAKS